MSEIRNRLRWEQRFATDLLGLNRAHKRELRRLLGEPPDGDNVPVEFWQRVERNNRDELLMWLILIFTTSAMQHGEEFGLTEFEATSRAQAWANNRLDSLMPQFMQTTLGWFRITSRIFRGRLSRGIEVTPQAIDERLEILFGKDRMDKLASTETTNAATSGSEFAIESVGRQSDEDVWWTVLEEQIGDPPCPICLPLHRTSRPFWSQFFPEGPPGHPNCRCWVQYAFEGEP